MSPTAGRAQVLRATTKRSLTFFEKKCILAASVHPRPQCEILTTHLPPAVRIGKLSMQRKLGSKQAYTMR